MAHDLALAARYSATLKARDSDGFETVVNSWDFEVQRVDTDVPAYGPGGRTCAHGTAIDGTAMDGAFSCNCSGSFYTGPNCDRFAAAATSSGRSGASETGFFAVIGVAVGVIVVVLVVLVVLGLRARNTRRKPKDFAEILAQLQAAGVLPKDADITPGAGAVPEELPRTSVAVGEEIGNGHFGAVRRGLLTHKFAATSNSVYTKVDVAIKVLLDDTAQGTLDFMRESAVTWQFNHPNVVQMFGVVTMGSPHMLVLELCHNGSLLGYLRRHGEGVETFQRIRFLQDIASGMHHLSGKGFVHRDLAARNVLLNAELVAKVADFGQSRSAPCFATPPPLTPFTLSCGCCAKVRLTESVWQQDSVASWRMQTTTGQLLKAWCSRCGGPTPTCLKRTGSPRPRTCGPLVCSGSRCLQTVSLPTVAGQTCLLSSSSKKGEIVPSMRLPLF